MWHDLIIQRKQKTRSEPIRAQIQSFIPIINQQANKIINK